MQVLGPTQIRRRLGERWWGRCWTLGRFVTTRRVALVHWMVVTTTASLPVSPWREDGWGALRWWQSRRRRWTGRAPPSESRSPWIHLHLTLQHILFAWMINDTTTTARLSSSTETNRTNSRLAITYRGRLEGEGRIPKNGSQLHLHSSL